MSAAVHLEPHLIHVLPGRLRVHLLGWSGEGSQRIERQLRQIYGVRSAQVNSLTQNVLVRYDATATGDEVILASLRALELDQVGELDDDLSPPPVLLERHGETRRARIAVRGLDSDPDVARRVVDHLEQRGGSRASRRACSPVVCWSNTQHTRLPSLI